MPKLTIASKRCQCPTCGEYFTNEKNFEMHRSGVYPKRRCVPPGQLVTKKGKARLRLNADGVWTRAEGAYLGKPKPRK